MAGLSCLPRGRLDWAVVFVIAFLVLVNVVDIKVAHASLVLGPGGAAGLLAVARWAGLSWAELGLGRGTWRRGLLWAFAAIGAVAAVFAAGAALPRTRSAFRDTRYDFGWGHALLTAVALVPVGTVLFEEVAFRGVLWGLLRRRHGTWVATSVSSALFGLWHVLPSLGLAADDQAIGSAGGSGSSGHGAGGAGRRPF